jgi:hypothetical protein
MPPCSERVHKISQFPVPERTRVRRLSRNIAHIVVKTVVNAGPYHRVQPAVPKLAAVGCIPETKKSFVCRVEVRVEVNKQPWV